MKKYSLIIAGLLLLMPLTSNAFSGQGGCGGNCIDCHKLEKKDAEAVLKKLKDAKNLPPGAEVKEVKLSPVGGLWQIDLEADGKRGAVYLDFSKKYLIGQIIPLEVIKPAEQRKVDFSKIPLKTAVVLGPQKAKKKVAVFTDPDCPYCRKLHDEMKQVLTKRNDVAFYLILNPLPMHKDAYKKVQAVLCEKSLTLLDDAFAGRAVAEPKCSNEQVEKNIELAKSLNFGGTPMIVRGDGTVLPGYLPAEQLSNWIDEK
jgi:thiol:disulfide interchange protein DsbC